MRTQLSKGLQRRVMYVENKDGQIDGADARIGWVTFSKSGQTVYYRGRTLQKRKGGGASSNFFDVESNEDYWISGVKRRGSNAHWAESDVAIRVDADALDEYRAIRSS